MAETDKPEGPRWIKTAENRFGVLMVMLGVASAGLFIAALAGGFEGWVWIAAAATVVLVTLGVLSLRAGARRKVTPGPIVYHPDTMDTAVDIDRETGNRTPHKD